MEHVEPTAGLPGLDDYLTQLQSHPADSVVAMDMVHVNLIGAMVMAKKPEKVLELGIGSGFVTRVLLAALRVNQWGRLYSVDSFYDWGGEMPAHIESLRSAGATIIQSDEESFLGTQPSSEYDLIVSDGDHVNSYFFCDQLFRIAKPQALIFFHDTGNPLFYWLGRIKDLVRRHGMGCYHFVEHSLPTERTERGLLMVVNSGRKVRVPLMHRLVYKHRASLERNGWFCAIKPILKTWLAKSGSDLRRPST